MITLIWFALGVASIPVAGVIARRRERNPARWMILALIFGPLTLIVLALLRGPRCPHCRRHFVPNATVCGHCGRDLPPRAHPWDEKPPRTYALGEGLDSDQPPAR